MNWIAQLIARILLIIAARFVSTWNKSRQLAKKISQVRVRNQSAGEKYEQNPTQENANELP